MQNPESPRTEAWPSRTSPTRATHPLPALWMSMAIAHDETPSLHARRRFHALAAIVTFGALAASAGLSAMDDTRPLDVQLGGAMRQAGDLLQQWQGQLSRGLQVSLRAVADGDDALPPMLKAPERHIMADARPAAQAVADDRAPAQPVEPAAR